MTHAHAAPAQENAGSVVMRACACHAKPEGEKCDACEEADALGVQPMLWLGHAGDVAEHEADRVADRVMAAEWPVRPVQVAAPVQRRAVAGAGGQSLGAGFTSGLAAAGPGRPLAASARAFLEPRFGQDLGRVRVHDDGHAATLARSIGARAFAHRSDVFMAAGEHAPDTAPGRRLLAHEIAHVLQQGGSGTGTPVRRLCTPAASCAAPIAGSPEEFSNGEAVIESGPRARRRRMTPARARSTHHAGRARQLEIALERHDMARRGLVHGVFLDADMSRGTGAMATSCADWAADSLPAGDPDPAGFAGAAKPCVFVHGDLNQQALAFNQGAVTVGGRPRDEWRVDTLATLVHETEHVRFDDTLQPGLARPAGVSTPTCTKAAVHFPLSEIVSIASEFPLFHQAAQAEANPAGPAHVRLTNHLNNSVDNPLESFKGALEAMGCKCDCPEVALFVVQAIDATSTSWSAAEKTAFRTEIRARMSAPGPVWPNAPTP